jgi:hypothetical protein
VSLDDILAASNVTFDEAKWALDALVAGYNEWPKIQSGEPRIIPEGQYLERPYN